MRLGGRVTLVVLLLAAGPSLGQEAGGGWTQPRGGADRAGVALLPEGALDVVASVSLLNATYVVNRAGPGLLATADGPIAVAQEGTGVGGVQNPFVNTPDATCQLVRFPDPTRARVVRVGEPAPCPQGGRLLAYDPARDLALVCTDVDVPTDPILFAWDATTGEERWRHAMSLVTPESPGVQETSEWTCPSAAIDGDDVYVAYRPDGAASRANRVERLRLGDGETVWAASIPVAGTSGFLPPGAPTGVLGQATAAFSPDHVTVTDNGVVLMGAAPGAARAKSMAWLDEDGRFVGSYRDSGTPAPGEVVFDGTGSRAAAGSGARAAAVVERSLVFVNPLNTAAETRPLPETAEAFLGNVAPPAWDRATLVVPLVTSALILDTSQADVVRSWAGHEGATIWDALLAHPGDAYFVTIRGTAEGRVGDVLRVDAATGRTLQRIPLPPGVPSASGTLEFLPLDGQLLVFDRLGGDGVNAAVLAPAPAERRPAIAVDTDYPAAGTDFSVTVSPRGGGPIAEILVAWGDGVVETSEGTATFVHQYGLEERYVIRATAVFADGTTATSEHAVFVGATPPAELTFMQRAFAPENQETTYAIAGLSLTLLGAGIATFEKKRRRGRVGREIHELHRIRDLASRDMPAALKELHAFHSRLELDHAHGALDDGQFGALELREQRLRETLRNRVLGPVAGRVTPRFLRALDAAFEDGVLEPREARDLREALRSELNLDEDDRARLAELFDAWARAGAEPAERAEGTGVRTGAPSAEGTGARTPAPSSRDAGSREGSP